MSLRSTSLRTRLVWLFLLFSAGPIFVSNLWGYLRSRDYVLDAAARNLLNVAELEATHTLRFLDERKRLLSSLLLEDEVLGRTMARWRAIAETQGQQAARASGLGRLLAQRLRDLGEQDEALRAALILDEHGRVVAEEHRDGAYDAGLLQACLRVDGRQPAVVGIGPAVDGRVVALGAPMRGPSGERLGALCTFHLFEVHRELVTAARVRAVGATLYLLDRAGRVVCGSEEDPEASVYGRPLHGRPRHAHGAGHAHDAGHAHGGGQAGDAGDHAHGRPEGLPPEALRAGRAWRGQYELGDGRPVFAVLAPVPELGWRVLIEQPLEEALSDLDRLKRQALAAGFFLIAVMGVLVVLTAQGLVRPLRSLMTAAGRMAEGHLGEHVDIDGPQEVEALAAAFNRMSEALRASQQALQERIEERGRQLARSEAMSELLLDAIEHRVMVLDRARTIVQLNAAARRQVPDGTEAPCVRVLGRDVARCERCAALQTFRSGRPASIERPVRIGERAEIVHIESYPIRGEGGEVERVVELVRLVTDERRTQAQMVHQEKMAAFGLLAAGVAHEIGNPLAAMLSQIRLARMDEDPERVRETLEVLEKGLRRIEMLLRDLVDFARRKRQASAQLDLRRVVDDVVRLVAYDKRARGIRIERDFPEQVPPVAAPEDGMTQVLFNLAINALDAMGPGGTLRFEVEVAPEEILVRVRDSGSGIEEAARARLFEPFFTTKPRGTGLGLFVSRGILEGIGGRLELESTGPQGSTFVVRLPVPVDPTMEASCASGS